MTRVYSLVMVDWNIGYAVGLGLVVVVVVLLVVLIIGASRAATRAETIAASLAQSRDNTAGLPGLHTTNRVANRIVASATAAREHLAGES